MCIATKLLASQRPDNKCVEAAANSRADAPRMIQQLSSLRRTSSMTVATNMAIVRGSLTASRIKGTLETQSRPALASTTDFIMDRNRGCVACLPTK
jgi:hypothetical protein